MTINTSLKTALNGFVSRPATKILWLAFFYCLWLVQATVLSERFELQAFGGRMIGEGTAHGYDIGARVALFYKSLLIFSSAMTVFMFAGKLTSVIASDLYRSTELRMINLSAQGGLLLLIFQLFRYDVHDTLEIIYFIHKFTLLALLIRALFFRSVYLRLSQYCFLLALAVSIYFPLADLITGISAQVPDFLMLTFGLAVLLLMTLLFLRNENLGTGWKRFVQASLPMLAFPMAGIFRNELFFALRNRGVEPPDQNLLMALLLIGFAILVIVRFYRISSVSDEDHIIFGKAIPLFVFSWTAFCGYSVVTPVYTEMFEVANRTLPVMELFHFGVIPTLEKFNSHLLSDYFFGIFYALIHGVRGNEILMYDFFNGAVAAVVYYFLIWRLSRSYLIAFFLVMMFPFYAHMLPEGHALCSLTVFAILKIFDQPDRFRNYLMLVLAIAFSICWRIDLGVNIVLACPLVLLICHYSVPAFRINFRLMLQALLIVVSSALVLVCIASLFRGINLFRGLPYMLNYISSAQSYGYISLGAEDAAVFRIHYFLFPALVLVALIVLISRIKGQGLKKFQNAQAVILIFLCIYYLANFNRGLVRHGLIENSDEFLSSFVYLVLPFSLVVFRPYRRAQFFVLTLSAFFLIKSYKVPVTEGASSLIERGYKMSRVPGMLLDTIQTRSLENAHPVFKEEQLFTTFIRLNTSAEETFLDFANTPQLYFFTGKETPSFFFQNPACLHNDFLQEKFIEVLKKYKAPFAVFSQDAGQGYEGIDGVPNVLRHYHVAEYLYRTYEPHVSIGRYNVWKRKDLVRELRPAVLFDTYPKVTGMQSYDFPVATDTPGQKYVITLHGSDPEKLKLVFFADSGRVHPPRYYQNDTTLCYAIDPRDHTVVFRADSLSEPARRLTVMGYSDLPDFNSSKHRWTNLKKVPYIWGTYDKKLNNEKEVFSVSPGKIVRKDSSFKIQIPVSLDRSSGNTVVISCRNLSDRSAGLALSFGKGNSKFKTTLYSELQATGKVSEYAIRISAFYTWHHKEVDFIELSASGAELFIENLKITKAR